MKRLATLACLALALGAQAQEAAQGQPRQQQKTTIEVPAWVKDIKLSGYGILQYQATDKREAKTNSFNLRLARLILDGKIADFDWRIQMQATNAKGPGEPTVQLVDLYTEWNKYKEVRVRAGQFKRAFTFENPTHPITQGWRGYADVINRLSGFGDRTGEKSSGGRDIGLQVQGDLLPAADGHRWVHYQVGVYNGEGINRADKDNRKDLIAGLWVVPVKGLRIGAFGWTGSHGDMVVDYQRDAMGNYVQDASGNRVAQTASVPLNRYALSAEWDKDQWLLRTEYLHSQGWGTGVIGSNVINRTLGDKADGWYVMGQVPVVKSKLHAKARYQVYRQQKDWTTSVNQYEVGANYFFTKNLQLNLEYSHVNDRTWVKHNYNLVDAELSFRF